LSLRDAVECKAKEKSQFLCPQTPETDFFAQVGIEGYWTSLKSLLTKDYMEKICCVLLSLLVLEVHAGVIFLSKREKKSSQTYSKKREKRAVLALRLF